MQTLGLADSTPRSESRLKSLFWPTITSSADVDYLGTQGYWVCTIVAVLSGLLLSFIGQPIMGVLFALYYYLGGIGVRERSVYAASAVFVLYLLNTVTGGSTMVGAGGIVRFLFVVILLSNVRATIIAAMWSPESQEAEAPARLSATWSDKLSDQLPLWLWPKIKVVYYIYSTALFLLMTVGWVEIILRRMPR